MSGETTSLTLEIEEISERANEVGIALEMWPMNDDQGIFIWISEFNRDPKTPAGTGRIWLDKVLTLAADRNLRVKLCCTSWNSALVDYYRSAGFQPLYEEGEEVCLQALPVSTPS
tara:strand:+ start:385 stop:729 length:345 start_codon:yes stop_codon:yes gene_type:complete